MHETGRAGRGFRRLLKVVAVEALVIILLGAAIGGWVGLSVSGHDPRLLLYVGLRVDAVQVTRGPDQPYVRVAPLSQKITDARAAQALYNAAFELPIMPSPINCPLGPMVVYPLTFSWHGVPVLTDELSLDGCETVTIGVMSTRLCDQSYMALLAQGLNMPVDAIENPSWRQLPIPGALIPAMGGVTAVPLVVRRDSLVL